jgi:hypothetical protein
VIASLLVSALIVGLKLNGAKEIAQITQRRSELKANLALLQGPLETEALALWIGNVSHDAARRQKRIVAMESTSGMQYSTTEMQVLEKGAAMFEAFESSPAVVKQLAHVATIARSETKHHNASGLLLGRAEAEIRTSALEIIAHTLNYYDSRMWEQQRAADPNTVRSEALQVVNGHHTVTFTRIRAPGMSDRTFLGSNVAKKIAEDPPTYVLAIQPIPNHDKIGRMDEARAVRGEVCRSFRLTEVGPGRTKLEYVCSLDVKGLIPQIITNTLATPQQMNGV